MSLFIIACNGKPGSAESGSSATPVSGGSARVDSLKSIGTGVNGESSNTLDAKDTVTNGHSAAAPSDTAKKKKP